MNRRWDDTKLREWLRAIHKWIADPWNQTHLVVCGLILPAALLILALEVL